MDNRSADPKAPTEIVGYVGVIDGKPEFSATSDVRGDTKTFDVYPTAEDAFERWYHVRRVRVIVDNERLTPPADWGRVYE